MKKAAITLLLVLVAAVTATGCEPKMTITAKMVERYVWVGQHGHIAGTVTPAKATKQVVLQRTIGGKWVDWKQYPSGFIYKGKQPIVASVDPATGAYRLEFYVDFSTTIHLRVRSAGGTATSPAFYFTPAYG